MKKRKKTICIALLIMVASLLYPTIAYANSAEPPGFTVVVLNAPDDLTISVRFTDGSQMEGIALNEEQRAWESYYRFYYTYKSHNIKDAILVIQSSKKNFQCSFPTSTFQTYNNVLTLDLESESLTIGQNPLRVPLLVTMRVVLTLLIEGVIFYLFGYRQKSSWFAFIAINLVTQGGLNAMFTGPDIGSYWFAFFILCEIVVLLVELIAFAFFVKEFKKGRGAVYTVAANVVSLLFGGLLITYLPI